MVDRIMFLIVCFLAFILWHRSFILLLQMRKSQTLQAKLLIALVNELLPKPRATGIHFYATINGRIEKVTKMFLKASQRLPISIEIVDKRGNPAKVDGMPRWESTDPELIGIGPSEDGMAAVITPSGNLGSCKVQVKIDADLGEGVKEIVGELDLEIIGGEAVTIKLNPGEPEDMDSQA